MEDIEELQPDDIGHCDAAVTIDIANLRILLAFLAIDNDVNQSLNVVGTNLLTTSDMTLPSLTVLDSTSMSLL